MSEVEKNKDSEKPSSSDKHDATQHRKQSDTVVIIDFALESKKTIDLFLMATKDDKQKTDKKEP